ncbi:MAG: DUF4355 domain-containing protein, partial [Peptoniphilaceae bacterium]|nr:DUF4355 domain-containing protein [Peptoniphilaceae bacterium]
VSEETQTKPEPNARTVAKYSDEDLDRIINAKVAKLMEKQEKKISEAKKLAEMDAQQKAEYERDQFKAQIEELLREKNRGEMMTTARAMLAEKEVHLGDDLLGMLVTEEAESTKQNAESFLTLFSAAVEDAVKDKLRRKTPAKMSGSAKLTKEEIFAIQDSGKRRQTIAEDMDLFN